MPSKTEDNLIVGLDIGTSKVVAIVGELTADNKIEIVGMGSSKSKGLKKGIVVDIHSTVGCIEQAIKEAELFAGCDITSVFAGIAGDHIGSLNLDGSVKIPSAEVTQKDIERVIDAASVVDIPSNKQIIHVLPQEYTIDGQDGIREPIGMSGFRLEAKVHIVTGSVSASKNIIKCVRLCDLKVDEIILQQLASSEAVLTDDEKELGVCLVDIGGGTTDVAVFIKGAIFHTAVIPIAGDHVTNDIAVTFRTPTRDAEEIKLKYACALAQLVNPDETIEVPSIGNRPSRKLERQGLADVVSARYQELFDLIQVELNRNGFEEMLNTGIVLTGGSAKIEGLTELAEEIFHKPVRIGVPHQHISGSVESIKNPIYSTSVGLLLFGRKNLPKISPLVGTRDDDQGMLPRIKSWFKYF